MAAKSTKINSAASPYILEEQVGFILRQVNQRHAAIFANRMGEDITPTRWAVLAKLYEVGPASQNHLGRMTAMDVATVKGVVDRLVQRGLICTASDDSDARLRLIGLSDLGLSLVESRLAGAKAITEETLAPLNALERETLLALLSKIK